MNRGDIEKHEDLQRRTRAEATQCATSSMADASEPKSEEFFRTIVENGEDFFAVLDLEGRRLYNSPSYANLFGDIESLKGSDSFAEIHPADVELVKRAFKVTVQSGRSHRLNFRFVLADGSIRYMESCGALIRNSQGQALRVVVVSRDITERMEKEQEIYNFAFYDALTQLPNRRLLNDRLDQAMATSKRSGRYGALMFLDLDNFKLLNDTHGHAMGDLLLLEVGCRITGCLREMDTVARLGGDEFVLVLCELDKDKARSTLQSSIVAEKIHAILAEPYELKFQQENKIEATIEYHCTASIGLVLFINHEASREDILKQADMAMYQAKVAGRNLIRFYDSKV
ncbi:MAG TPA: sensor domain-containing diguanylate cyclase [Burkholderiales bacterium]